MERTMPVEKKEDNETESLRGSEDVTPISFNGDIKSTPNTPRDTPSMKKSISTPSINEIRGSSGRHFSTPTPRDRKKSSGKAFTGKSTLLNPFGSSTTLSSAAPTEASDENFDDHLNVVLRVRPLNSPEITRRDKFVATFPGGGRIEVDASGSSRQFTYNVVFEPEATQEDLFDHSGVKKLIDMALNGYATTAFAFGQTGSGKTHTMTGPPQQFQDGKRPSQDMIGIMQRSMQYLFEQLNVNERRNKVIRASYLEIYNEQVIDLLNPNQRRYLAVRWSKNKGFYVENLFVVECNSADDLMTVLEEGLRNRQTGSHGLNEFSSRSHSMLTLTIDTEQQDPDDENLYITKRGKLTFVDLAGSEKVKDTNPNAEALFESNNINKSLLVLGNCISALGDAKKRQGHIPYRDSKLTKLLADSLGGNGVTLMIACITPSSHHVSETMNTLRYASRAKKIKTKPVVKMDPREKLILSLKKEIKVLRNENHYLRQQLEFPAKPKGQLQKENDEKFMKFLREQKSKDKTGPEDATNESGLYEMLQEYMVENEALRSENSDMHSTRDRIRREQQLLYRENEKLMRRVEDLERLVHQAGNPAVEQYNSHPLSPRGSPRPQYGRDQQGSSHSWRSAGRPPPQDQAQYAGPPSGPPSGYNSPTGSGGRGRYGPPPAAGRGQPIKPPHRLNEPIQRPALIPYHDGMQNGGYPEESYAAMNSNPRSRPPAQQNGPAARQDSPNRPQQDSRKSSQASMSESIKGMNEKLKQELIELEGQIHHNAMLTHRGREVYGSQNSLR